MAITYVPLQNSSYFDYTSYGTTDATTVEQAYGMTGHLFTTDRINVALTLPRANDPMALLTSDWATRQKELKELNDAGTLWSKYGASESLFNETVEKLGTGTDGLGFTILGLNGANDGYVSSAESRTIWVSLSPTDFQTLFNLQLYQSNTDSDLLYWNGSLSLPDNLVHDVDGIWFDMGPVRGQPPATSDQSDGVPISREQTDHIYPSIGNGLPSTDRTENYAGDMAKWFYDFPLTGLHVPTATIGIVAPGVGAALPDPDTHDHEHFRDLLETFRHHAGLTTPADFYVVAPNGEAYDDQETEPAGERAMDVAIVTTASPGSRFGLYAGSGTGTQAAGAQATAYTAYQAAIWDLTHNPEVITASFGFNGQTNPNSLFANALDELFIDAALRNITLVKPFNDSGSSFGYANGLANVGTNDSSPFVLVVGGTSLTTLAAAPGDGTLWGSPSSLYDRAMTGDQDVLWQLVRGGLTVLPGTVPPDDARMAALLESVWNTYTAQNYQDLISHGDAAAGNGGVDIYRPTPWYQTSFGLNPTSANPGGLTGRGAPDVAANAGGNMWYRTPDGNMVDYGGAGDGTSGASPFWAALMAQIDTIFTDQDLPHLGFANDLLYQAAAVAPAAFNDVTYGNNVSSFFWQDPVSHTDPRLTGHGYYAIPGYDLTTGLGSPNGTLLARALTAIAHSQMSHSKRPDMLVAGTDGEWQSGADQSLIFQAMSAEDHPVSLVMGNTTTSFSSGAANAYAWTSRLAQQSLQADFDSALVRLFDGHQQGAVLQAGMSGGENFLLGVDGSLGHAIQGTLSNPFGFADFVTEIGAVRVARPVAVAETVDAKDDQTAVLRMRQNGADHLSLQLYKVDDLSGAIDGLHPGEAGYEAAAARRAYHTEAGDNIEGPGYGEYRQTLVRDVDAGDLIAMKLTNLTTGETYWGFDQANEKKDGQPVGHLWNYGANTWGFEDTHGGGDRDFNDLILQLDFTSAYGHGWLI